MRKLVLSAAVAVLGIVGMNAQNLNTEALQLGVRAGLNMSTLNGDMPAGVDTKSLTGFHVGLFTEIPVAPRFSIQPEVIYSEQGTTLESSISGINAEADIKTQYVNVPILAKVYVAEGFNIQAGPQIGFLTGAELQASGIDDIDIKDDMKGTDFGLLLGAGYKLPMGLTIDARYNLGLSNTLDDNSEAFEDLGTDQNWRNGVFQVGLGYQF